MLRLLAFKERIMLSILKNPTLTWARIHGDNHFKKLRLCWGGRAYGEGNPRLRLVLLPSCSSLLLPSLPFLQARVMSLSPDSRHVNEDVMRLTDMQLIWFPPLPRDDAPIKGHEAHKQFKRGGNLQLCSIVDFKGITEWEQWEPRHSWLENCTSRASTRTCMGAKDVFLWIKILLFFILQTAHIGFIFLDRLICSDDLHLFVFLW